jgi:hypothetical protein
MAGMKQYGQEFIAAVEEIEKKRCTAWNRY